MEKSLLIPLENGGAEIIQFPKKLKCDLIADFIEANREFVNNFDGIEDVDATRSLSVLEDMDAHEDCHEYEFTLYGKILKEIRVQNLDNNDMSYIGETTYKTYSCIWKILYFDEEYNELNHTVAMSAENITRKIALLLPKSSH